MSIDDVMHIEEDALHQVIGQLAEKELASLGTTEALSEVVRAMPALFRVDGAGLMVVDETQVLRYVAATDSEAQLLEAVQESTGRGPCVEALVNNEVVEVADLEDDDRWPGLAALLVPNGVRAVLGSPLRVSGAPVGSINVYTRELRRWDESDRRALEAFDRVAERLVAGALAGERSETLVGQLQHALQARVTIERAVGFIMAKEDLTATAAFERLRQAARSSRRSAHDIAVDVVRRRGLP